MNKQAFKMGEKTYTNGKTSTFTTHTKKRTWLNSKGI